MKNKIILLSMLVFSLFSVLTLADVTEIDSITITTPSAGGTVAMNNSLFTGTYDGNSSVGRIVVYYNITNASTAVVCSDTTISANDDTWSCNGLSANFTDSCSQTILVGFVNVSGNTTSTNTTRSVVWDNTEPRIDTFALTKETSEIFKNLPYKITATDNCDTQDQMSYQVRAQSPKNILVRDSTSRTGSLTGTDINMLGTYNVSVKVIDRGGHNGSTNISSQLTFNVKGKGVTEEVSSTGLVPEISGQSQVLQDNKKQVIIFGSVALIVSLAGLGAFLWLRR